MSASPPERGRRLAIIGGLAAALLFLIAGGIALFLQPRQTAAERGREIFGQLGCSACHGPGGSGGVRNPGSKEREVPGFVGGTAMMYVESVEEIREWILDGRPGRLKQPAAGANALLKMPAYRGRIEDEDLDDLVAYYQAVAAYEPARPAQASAGRRLAQKLGCTGCHGPGGRLGQPNPGALKGYIPGWGSADFRELVSSEAELREWILDGVAERLRDHPVARWLRARQLIGMPAYREHLEPGQLDELVAYISWVSGGL